VLHFFKGMSQQKTGTPPATTYKHTTIENCTSSLGAQRRGKEMANNLSSYANSFVSPLSKRHQAAYC
jgi:hypothetical protein